MIDFHIVLLAMHLIIGALSFICGLIVFRKLEGGLPFFMYLWGMVAMSATLIGSIVWNWYYLDVFTQVAYGIVCLSMFYANFRSFEANHKAVYRYSTWRLDFITDVGISLTVLFCAMLILVTLEIKLPVWLALLIIISAVLIARKALAVRREQYGAKRSDRKAH